MFGLVSFVGVHVCVFVCVVIIFSVCVLLACLLACLFVCLFVCFLLACFVNRKHFTFLTFRLTNLKQKHALYQQGNSFHTSKGKTYQTKTRTASIQPEPNRRRAIKLGNYARPKKGVDDVKNRTINTKTEEPTKYTSTVIKKQRVNFTSNY